MTRSVLALFVFSALPLAPATVSGQATSRTSSGTAIRSPARAIRHDIPLTDMIRRAFDAGTRDSTGRPGPNYWQLHLNYDIDVSIDPATAMVSGHESITIHNTSPMPMQTIVLRLDQNIFSANVPRLESVPEITDGMQVTKLAVNGRVVDFSATLPRRRRGEPPPQLTEPVALNFDQTLANLVLPDPIAAGATANLDIEWNFRVPHVDAGRGLRMGAWGDSLYQVAQWYPRVAMFDDLRQGGWDGEPYLGPSEFYNNFGTFDVTIDAPAGWIVGATGVLQNPAEVLSPAAQSRLASVLSSDSTVSIVGANDLGPGSATAAGDRLRWHFVADTTGDFAWATSNRYLWDALRVDIPGRAAIPVNVLYLPDHAESFSRAPAVLRHALEFYSKLWMPYAFPQLTMVDGPELGMEYPMFIMSGTGAADHETGHEWWPMMVGVNETWYGFMDEGFNQYMNILSGADFNNRPARLDGLGQQYGNISGSEYEAPLMWDANFGGPLYSFQAYGKAPEMLSMLGGVVGDTAVWHAMSDYAKAWKFKHPSPWDYAFFMSNALHRDLGWFWYYWLFTTDAVDGSIANLTTNDSHTRVTVHQAGQMPSPVVLQVDFAPQGPAIRNMPNSTMVDDTTAIVTWPVDVWFDGSRDFVADLDFGGRTIKRVTLDPHGRFPDNDPSDNMWPRDPDAGREGRGGRGGGESGSQR